MRNRDDFPEQMESHKGTPAAIKLILLILLFAACFGGLACGGYFLFRSLRGFAQAASSPGPADKTAAKQTELETSKSPEKSLLGLIRKPSSAIVFQGTAAGKDGELLALISGEPVAAGAELYGVKVLEITRQKVLLRFDGKEYRLQPGEQLKP